MSLRSSIQQPPVTYVKCDRLQPRIEPVTKDLSPARGTARPYRFTPPQDSLFLTILSISIRNIIGEREQPCRSPTLTLKGFVVALLTRTQTSKCMYSDLMAFSNWPSMPYCNSTAQTLSLGMRSYAFSRSIKHALTSFAYSHDFSKICCKAKI